MKRLTETHFVHPNSNKLITIWHPLSTHGRIFVQGKRVPNNFPLTYEERREYVKGNKGKMVKMVMIRLNLSLKEAWIFIKREIS